MCITEEGGGGGIPMQNLQLYNNLQHAMKK